MQCNPSYVGVCRVCDVSNREARAHTWARGAAHRPARGRQALAQGARRIEVPCAPGPPPPDDGGGPQVWRVARFVGSGLSMFTRFVTRHS